MANPAPSSAAAKALEKQLDEAERLRREKYEKALADQKQAYEQLQHLVALYRITKRYSLVSQQTEEDLMKEDAIRVSDEHVKPLDKNTIGVLKRYAALSDRVGRYEKQYLAVKDNRQKDMEKNRRFLEPTSVEEGLKVQLDTEKQSLEALQVEYKKADDERNQRVAQLQQRKEDAQNDCKTAFSFLDADAKRKLGVLSGGEKTFLDSAVADQLIRIESALALYKVDHQQRTGIVLAEKMQLNHDSLKGLQTSVLDRVRHMNGFDESKLGLLEQALQDALANVVADQVKELSAGLHLLVAKKDDEEESGRPRNAVKKT